MWSSTVPTRPGWYWMRGGGDEPEVVQVLRAYGRHFGVEPGTLVYYRVDVEGQYGKCDRPGFEWCGPIALPEEPK